MKRSAHLARFAIAGMFAVALTGPAAAQSDGKLRIAVEGAYPPVSEIAIDLGFLKTPSGKGFALPGPAFADPVYFGVGPGIAVRKGERALVEKLDAALVAIMADGTDKRIGDKTFAFDIMPAWAKKK